MNTLPRPRPLLVIILDGWGVSFKYEGNAILAAETPFMDTATRYFPSASLVASGLEVGLPPGFAGNSEAGHRNIGAGRVEYQVMANIDHTIQNGSFYKNPTLLAAIEHVKSHHSKLHLIGLASPGGVHSHLNHLFALLDFISHQSLTQPVYTHVITDGQDAPPNSSLAYLRQIHAAVRRYNTGTVASVIGRFYAMDRNKNWERTKAAYDMLTGQTGQIGTSTPEQAINAAYKQNTPDEKIPATVITKGGKPIASIKENDAVIFFNFRPDRARQLTYAFTDPAKTGFPVIPIKNIFFATMTQYDPQLSVPFVLGEDVGENPLAQVISDAGLKQLHIAESEKYAHITYYLNVGHEQPFPGEDHILIRSSDIRNFGQKPQMEALRLTYRVLEQVEQSNYDVYFINFANADMVGHTGNYEAAKNACSAVDQCLTKIFTSVMNKHGAILITADHGKAEEVHPAGQPGGITTQHTTNPVPFHYLREELRRTVSKSDHEVKTIMSNPIGVLADVAPTILDILQIPKTPSMTGVSLLGSLR